MLNDLNATRRRNYESLMTALNNWFLSENKAKMFRLKLQTHTRSKDESLPELAQSIKKLTPKTQTEVTDVIALAYSDIHLCLKEVRPRKIDEAGQR